MSVFFVPCRGQFLNNYNLSQASIQANHKKLRHSLLLVDE